MKHSIEWYERGLVNSINTHKRNLECIARDQDFADGLERRNDFLAAQIILAKNEGKDGFDQDKYAINRINLGE